MPLAERPCQGPWGRWHSAITLKAKANYTKNAPRRQLILGFRQGTHGRICRIFLAVCGDAAGLSALRSSRKTQQSAPERAHSKAEESVILLLHISCGAA